MARPMDALSASQRRLYQAAFSQLRTPTPQAFAEFGHQLLDASHTPSRRGLQHPAARAVASLSNAGLRYLGVDAYLREGDVKGLVAALRQEVRLQHIRSRALWIAGAYEQQRSPTATLRVPFFDGKNPKHPPHREACLSALATGLGTLINNVLPATLEPDLTSSVPESLQTALLWVALHQPGPSPSVREAVDSCLRRKVTVFDRELLLGLVALLEEDQEGFRVRIAAMSNAQSKVASLHTPFGPTAFLSKPVAIILFGLIVVAARRNGRAWLPDLPEAPVWPEGLLEVLLDERGPDALVVFGRQSLDQPERVLDLEAATWRGRLESKLS